MNKIIPIVVLSLLLMGEDCETPPPNANAYCAGATVPELSSTGLFSSDEKNTIVGGTPSTDRRSTVYIDLIWRGFCSGVILGPHTILTAAHCNAQGYRVYLDLNKPDEYFEVNDQLLHPEGVDIMLLYVSEELPPPYAMNFYEKKFAPLCEGLTAQGWGQTELPSDVNYIKCPDDKEECLRESPYTVLIEEDRILKTKQITEGGICFGDSGGPLYAQVKGQPEPWLVGITSTTASSDCKVASSHVKVAPFKQWIIQNFESKTKPTP